MSKPKTETLSIHRRWRKVAVIGAGAWGTAVAIQLSKTFETVEIWAYERATAIEIDIEHSNSKFLEGFNLPKNIVATDDLNTIVDEYDLIFWAIPVQHMNETLSMLHGIESNGRIHINLSKGIEIGSSRLPIDILRNTFGSGDNYAVVSGPSFAKLVAAGNPTILVVASDDIEIAESIRDVLQSGMLRCYTSEDIRGIQYGGATKNIYAIAAGISDGMNLGENARSAVITRSIVEMTRLANAIGIAPESISGAAGLGDLILTSTSGLSRNYTFGKLIGEGFSPIDAIERIGKAIEGFHTVKALNNLALLKNVELPIAEAVYKILYENVEPADALQSLFRRTPKPEWWV